MPKLLAFLISVLTLGPLAAQQPAVVRSKKVTVVDGAGRRIAFELPAGWQLEGSGFSDARGHKIGEQPHTLLSCQHKTGASFIQELKAGYVDDVGSPKFVGSRTVVLGGRTWTEGIRNVAAWDGRQNNRRWYQHSFFTVLGGRCFGATFYSWQPALADEAGTRQLLASIKLL